MLVKVPVMRGIQLLDHLHVVDANLSPVVNKNRHTLSEAPVFGCAVDEVSFDTVYSVGEGLPDTRAFGDEVVSKSFVWFQADKRR